jgi:hypothetical protein
MSSKGRQPGPGLPAYHPQLQGAKQLSSWKHGWGGSNLHSSKPNYYTTSSHYCELQYLYTPRLYRWNLADIELAWSKEIRRSLKLLNIESLPS